MLCDFCKKNQATIFLSQIYKGEVIKLDLCEECARKLEVTDVQGVDVNELIEKIKLIQEENRHDAEQVCAGCGQSLDEMKKNGQLGCPECYESFQEAITVILQDNQKGAAHAGKIPRGSVQCVEEQQRLDWEQQLQQAIAAEDFETAARLRDRLDTDQP